ncbi:unnamed protein product [Polarella glacialis]|uniref:Uncharacterized protein n=1 Tax=Polarella glacialis TaxID=89957 RepID=A0A813K9U8_POLGL|nr:unnamed protein product [Polarella glacialis]
MDAAGKEYFSNKRRSKGEASSLPPYLHAWCAAILAASSLKDIPEGDRAVLVQHATSTDKPEMLLDHVFVARCSPAFEPGTFRVSFAVDQSLQAVLTALLNVLQVSGGELKHGTPPKSALERALTKLLVDLGEWTLMPNVS